MSSWSSARCSRQVGDGGGEDDGCQIGTWDAYGWQGRQVTVKPRSRLPTPVQPCCTFCTATTTAAAVSATLHPPVSLPTPCPTRCNPSTQHAGLLTTSSRRPGAASSHRRASPSTPGNRIHSGSIGVAAVSGGGVRSTCNSHPVADDDAITTTHTSGDGSSSSSSQAKDAARRNWWWRGGKRSPPTQPPAATMPAAAAAGGGEGTDLEQSTLSPGVTPTRPRGAACAAVSSMQLEGQAAGNHHQQQQVALCHGLPPAAAAVAAGGGHAAAEQPLGPALRRVCSTSSSQRGGGCMEGGSSSSAGDAATAAPPLMRSCSTGTFLGRPGVTSVTSSSNSSSCKQTGGRSLLPWWGGGASGAAPAAKGWGGSSAGSNRRPNSSSSSSRGNPAARQLQHSRSAIFELPSAWGARESLKRRGLLEDCRLVCELLVTAGCDATRALVRALLWVPQRRQQRRAAAVVGGGRRPTTTDAGNASSSSSSNSSSGWLSLPRLPLLSLRPKQQQQQQAAAVGGGVFGRRRAKVLVTTPPAAAAAAAGRPVSPFQQEQPSAAPAGAGSDVQQSPGCHPSDQGSDDKQVPGVGNRQKWEGGAAPKGVLRSSSPLGPPTGTTAAAAAAADGALLGAVEGDSGGSGGEGERGRGLSRRRHMRSRSVGSDLVSEWVRERPPSTRLWQQKQQSTVRHWPLHLQRTQVNTLAVLHARIPPGTMHLTSPTLLLLLPCCLLGQTPPALQSNLRLGLSDAPMPRLTLRRVRSVSRWDHSGAGATTGAAASVSAPPSPTGGSGARRHRRSSGGCWPAVHDWGAARRVVFLCVYTMHMHAP
jgi:hypothetical protein